MSLDRPGRLIYSHRFAGVWGRRRHGAPLVPVSAQSRSIRPNLANFRLDLSTFGRSCWPKSGTDLGEVGRNSADFGLGPNSAEICEVSPNSAENGHTSGQIRPKFGRHREKLVGVDPNLAEVDPNLTDVGCNLVEHANRPNPAELWSTSADIGQNSVEHRPKPVESGSSLADIDRKLGNFGVGCAPSFGVNPWSLLLVIDRVDYGRICVEIRRLSNGLVSNQCRSRSSLEVVLK